MRKAFTSLAAAAIAFGVLALPVSSASAASSPTLVCNIQPSDTTDFASVCATSWAAPSYSVSFVVQGGSGTYSYAWPVPRYATVGSGCTSTSSYCALTIRGTIAEHDLFMSVVLTQSGIQTTLTAEADVPAVCGHFLC
jgi:hypothetical protein